MKVKLHREVLVGPTDVKPTPAGTVVDLDDTVGREFISNGLGDEHTDEKTAEEPESGMADESGKMAERPENKMAHEPENKAHKPKGKP